MIFGKENDKGLILEGLKLKLLRLVKMVSQRKNLLVHDAFEPNPGIQYMLANMTYPEYPVALGIIRSVPGQTYERAVQEQIAAYSGSISIKKYG
jgi:2-oxoglutarate/2-oxoacid ferredoxin oxidoreductase subunit beta